MSRQRALMQFRLVPVAIARLAERRIDARPLLARLGMADAPRAGPLYLPLAKVRGFLDGCARLAGDPWFGWHLATSLPLGYYGLIEYVMRTSDTLRGGIEAICRYGTLVNGLISFDLVEHADQVGFGLSIAGEREAAGAQLNEYTLHYMLRLCRSFGEPNVASSIELAHRRDARHAADLSERAQVPVRFGASSCRIWIPRAMLALRSSLADPGLHQFLTEQIASAFAADVADDVVRAVRDVLASRLGRASLDISDVARVLAASPRTLQRRLRDSGTSYRDVVDLVRHQRARELVLVETLSIAEIAARVGYDDPGVFTRAFRRWTGRSPREERRAR